MIDVLPERPHHDNYPASLVSLSSASSVRSMRTSSMSIITNCMHCKELGVRTCLTCSAKLAASARGRRPSSIRSEKSSRSFTGKEGKNSLDAERLLVYLSEEHPDISSIQKLLESNRACVSACEQDFGWTPVHFAAHCGNVQLLRLLLESDADVDACCRQGNVPLHVAARCGHVDVATLLFAHGAEINARNVQGWTPLMWCAIAGFHSLASLLVDADADVTVQDASGRTACMWAARHGHAGMVRMFLTLGIDLGIRDQDDLTLRDHAEEFERNRDSQSRAAGIPGDDTFWSAAKGALDLTSLLVQNSATEGLLEESPVRPVKDALAASQRLFSSAKGNQWNEVEEALREGACVSTKGPDSSTPLMWAAIHNAPAAAMNLVFAKALTEARDAFGWTALHHAVHSGSSETVSVLHYLGADFSARTDYGDTAQHLAVRADNTQMLQLLAAATLDLEVQDEIGDTLLQSAARRNNVASVRTLLALCSNVGVRDQYGRSVLGLAAVQGHTQVIQTLLQPVEALAAPWDSDHVALVLQNLPWVGADESADCRDTHEEVLSSGSMVSSRGGSHSHTSNKTGATAGAGKRSKPLVASGIAAGISRRKSAMSTIREEGSEVASTCLARKENGTLNFDDQWDSHSRLSVASKTSARSKISLHSNGTQRSENSASSHSKVSRQIGESVQSKDNTKSKGSRMSSNSRKASKRSQVGARTKETAVADNPVGLLDASCKAAATRTGELPSPIALSPALSAVDDENRTPLVLAAKHGHLQVVAVLLELKAALDESDSQGNTALMLAASSGNQTLVTHLLAARASVEDRNANGQQPIDLVECPELRQLMQTQLVQVHSDRDAMKRSMKRSCSLPALVAAQPSATPPASADARCRIRLDGLPTQLSAEDLEDAVRDLLQSHGAAEPSNIEVISDPITLRARGHAFVDFPGVTQAQLAGTRLMASSAHTLRVSGEAGY
eukprot:TRINITY_DN27597_c0_g2_i1.p1 TRINITY_DN27597_c0_g2~~TRINITY_DN27597_c0_g2_i1.p1  ORF type:complete len:960 (-),score=139.10 TRINITY_DN27597_c0_g2_i1:198-3077(-)